MLKAIIDRGLNRIRRKLDYLSEYVNDHADPVFRKYAEWQRDKLAQKAYPPELPNQKYQRTLRLQRSFTVRKLLSAQYAIGNTRPGSVYVIKRGRQNRKYHEWRWWTVDEEIENNIPVLGKSLLTDIEEGLEDIR